MMYVERDDYESVSEYFSAQRITVIFNNVVMIAGSLFNSRVVFQYCKC